MAEPTLNPEPGRNLPRARVSKGRWRLPLIWGVPAVATLVAAWLVYERVHMFGPEIRIRFVDATGLRAGQSVITFRGVRVGVVTGMEVSEDREAAVVTCRLLRGAASMASEGARFWIVRPEVGMAGIRGLGTIITGPHIELLPGGGARETKFVGLERAPAVPASDGLNLLLLTTRLNSIRAGVPVYYRGVEVGRVRDSLLSTNAMTVDIRVIIEPQYTNLVRMNSRFWNVSGLDMRFGLFRGAEINIESLRSLAMGGISFATPPEPGGGPAVDGAVFRLYEEAQDEWLQWNPAIPIRP